ncbi:vacuolar import/degradation protein Vid24 [Pseudohyphozyma bogoriensis]|nr:vacuolar import/degradation protein Vid24 [Pseudohyphozyma bogoriensis]
MDQRRLEDFLPGFIDTTLSELIDLAVVLPPPRNRTGAGEWSDYAAGLGNSSSSSNVSLRAMEEGMSPSARARRRARDDEGDVRSRLGWLGGSMESEERRRALLRELEMERDRERERIENVASEMPEGNERWAVKVVIQSYDSATRTLSGLMHALGVPDSTGTVTTYFSGEILDPGSEEGLWTKKWGAGRKEDIDNWARVGPFAEMLGVGGGAQQVLKSKSGDRDWLREVTEGWVLMRWKEQEFVNVSPAESTLSIAGFYLVAMNRLTGALEGALAPLAFPAEY